MLRSKIAGVVLVLGLAALVVAGDGGDGKPGKRARSGKSGADGGMVPGVANPPKTGLATLFAHDPITHSFSFAHARPGGIILRNEVLNAGNDIDFNHYHRGEFTVGVEGGKRGVIVDLGAEEDLAQRYGYDETVGGGQGFASLRRDQGTIVILKDREKKEVQKLTESAELFAAPEQAGEKSSHAAVRLGHHYLIRITDEDDPAYELLVKFIVVAHRPDESVVLRWQILE